MCLMCLIYLICLSQFINEKPILMTVFVFNNNNNNNNLLSIECIDYITRCKQNKR